MRGVRTVGQAPARRPAVRSSIRLTPIATWASDDEDVPDAGYFVYGKQQDVISLRTPYLRTALQISNPHYLDGEFFLLNPQIVTASGEWEAWFFANWLPGAIRYRTFRELMQGEYERFLAIKDM